jgi:hypothetical protein
MLGSVASNRGLVKDVLDATRRSFFSYKLAQLFARHLGEPLKIQS